MIFTERKEYIELLTDIYHNALEESPKKANMLIGRLTDTFLMMDECREHINSEGCVTEMPQGNYSIERESPWSKVYDAKNKVALSIMDKLDKISVPDKKVNANANLLDWVNSH